MQKWHVLNRGNFLKVNTKFIGIFCLCFALVGCHEQENLLLEWAKTESAEAFRQACVSDFTTRFQKNFVEGLSVIHSRYQSLAEKFNPLLLKNEKFLKKNPLPSEDHLKTLSDTDATALYKSLYYKYSDRFIKNSDVLLSFDSALANLEKDIERFDKTCETFGEDYLIPPADLVGMLGNFSSRGFSFSMSISVSFALGTTPDGSNPGSFSTDENLLSSVFNWINKQAEDILSGKSSSSILKEAFNEMKNRLPSIEKRREWAKEICQNVRKKELVDGSGNLVVDKVINSLKQVIASTRNRIQHNHQALFYFNSQFYDGLKKRAYAASVREILAMERIFQLNQDFMDDFELTTALNRDIFSEYFRAGNAAALRNCDVAKAHFQIALQKIELLEKLLKNHALALQSNQNQGLDRGWDTQIRRCQSRVRSVQEGLDRLKGRGLCQF